MFLSQQLVFNSVTNCLGPRKFLRSGKLYKAKSSKELHGFLFNDFLLLTQIVRPLGSSGSDKVFSPKSNLQYKMYKTVSRPGSPALPRASPGGVSTVGPGPGVQEKARRAGAGHRTGPVASSAGSLAFLSVALSAPQKLCF